MCVWAGGGAPKKIVEAPPPRGAENMNINDYNFVFKLLLLTPFKIKALIYSKDKFAVTCFLNFKVDWTL